MYHSSEEAPTLVSLDLTSGSFMRFPRHFWDEVTGGGFNLRGFFSDDQN